MPSEGKFVVGVLVASVLVALVLAFQAIAAARSRQAVTDAMLRQYAELAAWEFSRDARKSLDEIMVRALNNVAHPPRPGMMMHDDCDCMGVKDIEYWFHVTHEGKVVERGTALPAEIQAAVNTIEPARRAGPVDGVLLRPLDGPGGRFIALKWEPHLGEAVSHIGLVSRASALTPLLDRSYRRTTLLPPAVTGGRDSRELVNLRVTDSRATTIFASPATEAGPQEIEASLLQDETFRLNVFASMTPAFVATLGQEHGGGPNGPLIVGLVMVNALMVAIGLWQLARERELARLREDFVAGVSHELRTPLAQIRMFTDTLLLDRIRNPQEGRRAIEIIGRETRRLSQLVENVLYFHRHRRAPAAAPGTAMSLSALVLDVTEGFRPLAAARRVRLSTNIPAHEVIVVANADGLRQVVLNLLDNAVKFGPADATVNVSLQMSGDRARLAVEDQGAGVPAEDRRRIFEPFERGDGRGAGGAGIGLAVVHQIVAEHDGHTFVEDAATGGARFVVELPLAPDEPAVATLAG